MIPEFSRPETARYKLYPHLAILLLPKSDTCGFGRCDAKIPLHAFDT